MKKVIIGTVLLLTTTLSAFSQTKNITVAGSFVSSRMTRKSPQYKPQYSYFRYRTVHLRRVSPLQRRDISPCPKCRPGNMY